MLRGRIDHASDGSTMGHWAQSADGGSQQENDPWSHRPGFMNVANFLQHPSDKHNPTPNHTTTPSTTMLPGEPPTVTILSQTPRDRQTTMMDTCDRPHHSGTDGISDHQAGSDEKIRHQSAITGKLCRRVLAHIKWQTGVDTDVDASVMDVLGCWLCYRGITVYIDPM
jgi:hypothetical protein